MKRAALLLAALSCAFTAAQAQAQSDDLIAAAGRGDLPAVSALLNAGSDVNDTRNTGLGYVTALMEASSHGHVEVVQALLAAKANIDATHVFLREDGITALAIAARDGHLDVAQALLAAQADVDTGSIPPLYFAVSAGNPDMVKLLLAAKPNLDWRDPLMGTNILMQALSPIGNIVGNEYNRLPSTGRWDIAQMLIEAGANVNTASKAGVTPLMLVAQQNNPRALDMVRTLLAAHADVNGGCVCGGGPGIQLRPVGGYMTADGHTALGLAASTGTVEVVQALLDTNAQRAVNPSIAVNAKQPGGNTPLTLAASKGRTDVVRLLLANKADAGATNDAGKTALTLALENGHAEVASLLQ